MKKDEGERKEAKRGHGFVVSYESDVLKTPEGEKGNNDSARAKKHPQIGEGKRKRNQGIRRKKWKVSERLLGKNTKGAKTINRREKAWTCKTREIRGRKNKNYRQRTGGKDQKKKE